MKKTFREHVQKKSAKWPSERGFDKDKWDELWEKNRSDNELEIGLHKAGHIFDSVFSELRSELNSLYDRCPSFSREKLLQVYLGVANRHRRILSGLPITEEGQAEPTFLHSHTFKSTASGNPLTIQEVADNFVDAIQKAVTNLIRRKDDLVAKEDPMDPMNFVMSEVELSNLYDIYESYWMALVWGDYKFSMENSSGDTAVVTQQRSDIEESRCLSLNRKMKLKGHEYMLMQTLGLHNMVPGGLYIAISGSGKGRTLSVKDITKADDYIKLQGFFLRNEIDEIGSWFSPGLIESVKNRIGVSIVELLEIFRLLSLLANAFAERFPKDSGIRNPKQLYEFCPKVKMSELVSAVSLATKLGRDKCAKAIDYLTFTGTGKRDLWCHPIVKVSQQQCLLLTSAMQAPMVTRLVENWLDDLDVDMSAKGGAYEKLVYEEVSGEIRKNDLFKDCKIEHSKVFTDKDGGSEEIDLIIKIGNLIVVGESKSIVTSDSPISAYRAKMTLLRAASQAKRKADFFKKNADLFLSQLKWDISRNIDLKIFPLVVDGGKALVGAKIDGVSICDERILKKFFESGEFPLLSKDSDTHYAWFNVYKSFQEAEDALPKYLENPPQMARPLYGTQYLENHLPQRNSLPAFIFKRLAQADIRVSEIKNAKTPFPIETSTDFEIKIKELDILA